MRLQISCDFSRRLASEVEILNKNEEDNTNNGAKKLKDHLRPRPTKWQCD
jgi:hypothetical protein